MANEVKITNAGTSDLEGAILTNAATEETLRELLEATKKMTGGPGKNKSPFDSLIRSSEDARDEIDEFSDELESSNKTLKAYNIASKAAGASVRAFDRSMRSIGNVSSNAQGQLEEFGAIASSSMSNLSNAASGAGGALSMMRGRAGAVGIGLSVLGAGLSMLSTVTTAVVGAMSTVIGMAQGFQESFNRISATGFTLDGSFQDLVNSTLAANLTLGQFAGVIERNRVDMAMFGGSVNRGARRVLELREAMSEEMVGGFVNMGVSLEEIPDALSRYMVLMGRSGRLMGQTDQEAVKSARNLFRQQRLLADLTGNSVEAIQNEALERTRATRVQAAFNEMVPGAAQAYANAAGMVEAELGPGLARGFEAIFAGDVTDPIYQAMMGGAPQLTAALESVRAGIATGAIDQENAQQAMFLAIQNGGPAIKQELDRVAEIVRYSGIETPLNALGEGLGIAMERLSTISTRSYEEAMAQLERQEAGARDAEGEVDPMLKSFRNITMGAQTVQVALQKVASQITNAIGDEASGVFVSFADALTTVTRELLELAGLDSAASTVDGLGSPIPSGTGVLDSAISGAAGMGATGAITGFSMAGPYGAAVGGLVGTVVGGIWGAATQHIENLQRNQGRRTLNPSNYIDPLGDDYIPGASIGGILSGPNSGYLARLHGTEAVVPLPNNRSIPVDFDMSGIENTGLASSENANEVGRAFAQNFATSIDSSRSLPELVNISRNMLNQMVTSTQKLEQMIRAMEQGNSISRNAAYARA